MAKCHAQGYVSNNYFLFYYTQSPVEAKRTTWFYWTAPGCENVLLLLQVCKRFKAKPKNKK